MFAIAVTKYGIDMLDITYRLLHRLGQ
jgi:hypothetical protein